MIRVAKLRGMLHRVGAMGPVLIAALVLASCGQLLQSQATPTAWDSPLPHSAKGYELYSWPAEQGDEWEFTLITGTNRLKTLEEIVAADVASESEWVKISVSGTEALKAVLDQLPQGERVTWISGEWLEQVGGPAGSIQLPGKDVVDEIEGYCRELGIELTIA